uniref:Uncharacterized protein n=1 Tax=Octactis speculum TaxID=3111310 RepID=A0A7S2BNE1_9STRA|mmetsp:Transcript_25246/g.34627  ORF Transcript_25246/g.34627 Transcript_25246/m.34627 type:complete len:126 (+) Transcript_25246:209-586(+)
MTTVDAFQVEVLAMNGGKQVLDLEKVDLAAWATFGWGESDGEREQRGDGGGGGGAIRPGMGERVGSAQKRNTGLSKDVLDKLAAEAGTSRKQTSMGGSGKQKEEGGKKSKNAKRREAKQKGKKKE